MQDSLDRNDERRTAVPSLTFSSHAPATCCHVKSVHCQWPQQLLQQAAPACHHQRCSVLKTAMARDADTPLNNARSCHTKPSWERNRHLPLVYTIHYRIHTRLPGSRIGCMAFVSCHHRQCSIPYSLGLSMYELYNFQLCV